MDGVWGVLIDGGWGAKSRGDRTWEVYYGTINE